MHKSFGEIQANTTETENQDIFCRCILFSKHNIIVFPELTAIPIIRKTDPSSNSVQYLAFIPV